MKQDDIISSGSLEALALGILPKEQAEELKEVISMDDELRKEFDEIEQCMDQVAHQLAIDPPIDIKTRLLERINPVTPKKELRLDSWKYISGIAASLTLVAVSISIFTWSQYQKVAGERDSLLAEKQFITENFNQTKLELDRSETLVSVYKDKSTRVIDLAGTENAPDASLRVLYQQSGQVYIDLLSLPQLSESQQYQLWAIIDGIPVDAGVFSVADGFRKMKDLKEAAAFAVTIEPRGGSKSPTLEKMVVIGNVG